MGQSFVGLLIGLVIALGLTATVATSTTSASTALAPFAGAQALIIIVPLIWVALILYAMYQNTQRADGLSFQYKAIPRLIVAILVAVMVRASRKIIDAEFRVLGTSRV